MRVDSTADVDYLNIAAYKFVSLDDLPRRRKELRRLAEDLELCGTILLSPEGINLFIAGLPASVESFLDTLHGEPSFSDLIAKRSWTHYQPFRRMLVKIKREIIAFGIDSVRPQERTSPKLTPRELKQWLDEGKPVTLLDTRNDYEVALGTFRGAIDLGIHHFRDFPKAVETLPTETRDRPLVMFCTGGIRCEKAGPFLEQSGFKNVFQLDGGILNYFEQCGSQHYDGDCFVFDHRVAVTPTLEPSGAKLCFNCQATLNADDLASDRYRVGISCPHCYTSPEEQARRTLTRRRQDLADLAEHLPGSQPYELRQPMFVARQFAGLSLIDWLSALNPSRDRTFWLQAIEAGQMVTGNHYLNASTVMEAGDKVREGQVVVHLRKDYVEPWVDGRIEVLYEDPTMVAVHKPSPLPCHASGQYCRHTLEYLLGQIYRPERLLLAHRLDAAVSGVVVLSRRYAVASKLQKQFERGSVEKTYVARVVGQPTMDRFECHQPIGRTRGADGRRAIDADGDRAHTEFIVQKRLGDGTTLLDVIPHSGRTHQIRLHLSALGFPIVGDPLYGDPFDVSSELHRSIRLSPGQLCLHAWRLAIDHPVSGQRMTFAAPLPAWFEARA